MNQLTQPRRTETAVLAVLTGQPLAQAAARAGIDVDELSDAVALYRSAGQSALADQAARGDWHQVRIQFTDWDTAETIAATHLAPRLNALHDAALLGTWWYIRKAPCWRLRLLPAPGTDPARLHAAVAETLGSLVVSEAIVRWRPTVYEPEALAFGGPATMDTAHRLFHADSRHLLDHALSELSVGRRELSVLLCTALFRAASQEWHEQGDVWHRVARMRPLPSDVTGEQLAQMSDALLRLMSTDLTSLFAPDGTLGFAAPWAAAFTQAGREIGQIAQDGALQRGTRDVLAHHVIFHWNRLGLAARAQAVLAHAAANVVMNPTETIGTGG
ncbi:MULTISPECIES: thiopeptide-type bacteriocin biosynthesis protein [unclassified Streptomyces]|uniref:thiopeptide-type bacteriocin biosynthesis protein n=1 Tax=unclassified Streptomyces TaxID=2593676 RepID=UPI003650BF04